MRSSLWLLALTMVLGPAATETGWAVPTQVPYVGYLTTTGGAAFSGTVNLQAALFDSANPDPSVDTPEWGPWMFPGTSVEDGFLSVTLGAGGSAPLDTAVLQTGDLWLAIWVDGQLLSPAQRILSVPFAVRASDADAVAGVDASSLVADLAQAQADILALQASGGGGVGLPSDCSNLPNGQLCSDGNLCTINDSCQAGSCQGATGSCDDGDGCTANSCNPASGCSFTSDPLACNDNNSCTTDACQSPAGTCSNTAIPNCCGNGIVEGSEFCDDGDQVDTGACLADCSATNISPTVPGFSGTLGPSFVADGFSQCGGMGPSVSTLGAQFYSQCAGYSEIRFACSVDNNLTAEYISPVFPLAGVNLTDGNCDNFNGASNSPHGSDFILSVDSSNPSCNQFSVHYDMYVHFGTQWGCNGMINTHGSGRMWAYVR